VKAFYFDRSAGIILCIGTWHELPFPTTSNTNFIIILTNETVDNLGDQDENGEAKGGDLDKVRIRRRFGHGIFIQP
jgi:ureidoglycolate lyase